MTEITPSNSDPLKYVGFTEEELLQGLRRGLEDPGARVLLDLWRSTMEAVADANPDPDVGRLVLEIQRATLYSKAGLHEDAKDAWYDAQYYAEATGRARLIEEVRKQREIFQVLSSKISMTQAEFHKAILDFTLGLNS